MMKTPAGMAATLALAVMVAGCNTVRLQTHDQWQAEAQRVYFDRSPEQVIRAAEAVLNSVNPGNLIYKHSQDGFLAHIPFHAVGLNGVTIFDLKVKATPSGTHALLAVTENGSAAGSPYEAAVDFVATYRLFFNWLTYALGKSNDWVPCDQVESKFGIANGNNPWGLCGPGVTPGGTTPVEPQPEWTRPTRR